MAVQVQTPIPVRSIETGGGSSTGGYSKSGYVPQRDSPESDSLFVPERKPTDSTWLVRHEGQLWPVVICDDKTAPPRFLAARKDEAWQPALRLGQRKYIWLSPAHSLEQYDPSVDYLTDQKSFKNDTDLKPGEPEHVSMLRFRYKAFTQDAPEGRTAAQWFQYIVIDKEIKANRTLLAKEHDRSAKKRKYCEEQAMVTRPNTTALYGRAGVPSRKTHEPRKKFLLPGELSTTDEDNSPLLDADDIDEEDEAFARLIKDKSPSATGITRADGSEWIQSEFQEPPSHGYYDIFVGDPSSLQFRIPSAAIDRCEVLANEVEHNQQLGSFVDLSKMGFQLCGRGKYVIDLMDFLTTGDFVPRTISPRGMLRIGHGQEERDRAAEHVAFVFREAGKFELDELQSLCLEKVSRLAPSPISALRLGDTLLDTKRMDSHMKQQVWGWVANNIIENYWVLLRGAGGELAFALQSDTALQAEVFRGLFRKTGYSFQ